MNVRLLVSPNGVMAKASNRQGKILRLAVWLASLMSLMVAACDNCNAPLSEHKGHYENMTREEAEGLVKKKPSVVPEYALTEKVILGSDLVSDFGLKNTAIPKAILDAGADIIIIGSQMANEGLESHLFAKFSEKMAPYKSRIKVLSTDMPMIPSTWARDWAPIAAVTSDKKSVLLDFNYYNERPTDDYTPTLIAQETKGFTRLSVPMYLEGGNLLTTSDGTCLTTERTVEANNVTPKSYIVDDQGAVVGEEGSAPVLSGQKIIQGFRYFDRYGTPRIRTDEIILSRADIETALKEAAGCSRVVIFTKLPYESTGHVDMWAKTLTDKIILVSAMDPKALSSLSDKKLKSIASEMGDFLNQRAKDLSDLGFEVVRIPMPLPHVKNGPFAEKDREEYGFRSYTNSLLLSTKKGRFILLPHYEKGLVTNTRAINDEHFSYPDQDRLKDIETEVNAIYSKLGFTVVSLNADQLVAYGGAIHCATMQLPAPQ